MANVIGCWFIYRDGRMERHQVETRHGFPVYECIEVPEPPEETLAWPCADLEPLVMTSRAFRAKQWWVPRPMEDVKARGWMAHDDPKRTHTLAFTYHE